MVTDPSSSSVGICCKLGSVSLCGSGFAVVDFGVTVTFETLCVSADVDGADVGVRIGDSSGSVGEASLIGWGLGSVLLVFKSLLRLVWIMLVEDT